MKENSIEEDIKILEELRIAKENYIPVQKIKDKTEELNRKIDKSVDDSKRILQELLESEK